MLRIILAFIFGYIIFKAIKMLSSVFFGKQNSEAPRNIYNESNSSSKIDKEDVIEAQFEEIEVKDNSASKK